MSLKGIKPPVWSRRFVANLSKSDLTGWAAVLGFAALTIGPFGLATRALTAQPANWIQANLTTRRRTKPAGLIESCMQGVAAPPQTLGRLRRKNGAGGSSPPDPLLNGVWGRAPTGSGVEPERVSGGGASPPLGLRPDYATGKSMHPEVVTRIRI